MKDTIAGTGFNADLNVPGFSVRYNQSFFDLEKFRHYFRSDFLNVILISEGDITFRLNLEKYAAKKNDLVIVAPHAIRKVETVSKDTLVSGVNFTMEFLSSIGLQKNAMEILDYFSSNFSPYWELSSGDAAKVKSLMKQLNERISDLNKHEFGKELLCHTFYIFLYEVYGMSKKYAVQVKHHVSRKENLVMNFTHLVQKQLRKNRSVQEYAEQLNITPKYLTESVKEITGKTAGEIIDSYVMLEAKMLLDDPVMSIAQIAEELQFSDQSFFGKFFKRHAGISPIQYRRSV